MKLKRDTYSASNAEGRVSRSGCRGSRYPVSRLTFHVSHPLFNLINPLNAFNSSPARPSLVTRHWSLVTRHSPQSAIAIVIVMIAILVLAVLAGGFAWS